MSDDKGLTPQEWVAAASEGVCAHDGTRLRDVTTSSESSFRVAVCPTCGYRVERWRDEQHRVLIRDPQGRATEYNIGRGANGA